jgi:hypothetical protein
MGNMLINGDVHFVKGIDPVADFNNGAVTSDIIEVMGDGIGFLYYKGVSAGADAAVITVTSSSDTAAAATTAVPFWYKVVDTTDSGWTAATATGFTITSGSSQLYEIRAPKDVFASTGHKYARLLCTEGANIAVVGCVLCYVYGLRYGPQPVSLID